MLIVGIRSRDNPIVYGWSDKLIIFEKDETIKKKLEDKCRQWRREIDSIWGAVEFRACQELLDTPVYCVEQDESLNRLGRYGIGLISRKRFNSLSNRNLVNLPIDLDDLDYVSFRRKYLDDVSGGYI